MGIRSRDREKADISSHPPFMPIVLDEATILDFLGVKRFISSSSSRNSGQTQMCTSYFQPPIYERMIVSTSARLGQIGVAVGLAWTSVGGEVMVVEATKMIGDGNLVLTGQLGDVMKESATLALSWIRSNSKRVTHISFIIHQKRQ